MDMSTRELFDYESLKRHGKIVPISPLEKKKKQTSSIETAKI